MSQQFIARADIENGLDGRIRELQPLQRSNGPREPATLFYAELMYHPSLGGTVSMDIVPVVFGKL
jgi:hypothetical protein